MNDESIKEIPFWKRSLIYKLIIPVVVVSIIGIAAVTYVIPRIIKQNAVDDAIEMSKNTVTQYKALRKYYTEHVIKKVLSNSELSASFNHKTEENSIPLPATMIHDLSENLEKEGTHIKLYSKYPFPNRKDRVLDEFATNAWIYLQDNPEDVFTETIEKDGHSVVRVGIADRMVADVCVNCHNTHPQTPKIGWKLGDIRGVLEVESSIDNQLENGLQLSQRIMFILFALIVVILISIVWVFKKQIAALLTVANEVTLEISKGNLLSELYLSSGDEISNLFNSLYTMQTQLTRVILGIRSGANEMSIAVEQVSQGNANLSQRTQEQASSLEEASSSMEEMGSTVNQNASNAEQANQLAKTARDQAERSGEVAGQAVAAMNEINDASKQIADIIGVIDEIAFQTNLLALNAAVEAARAGEQGRGFAVVASEVRNLAGRSAVAAKEIKGLIQNSVTKVESGTKLVNKSSQDLEDIVLSVKKVSDIVAEIASASQEQSDGITQVNKALLLIDEMTQQNASLVEEAAAASEAMGAQAQELNNSVAFFKIDDSAERSHDKPGTIGVDHKLTNGGLTTLPQLAAEDISDDAKWEEL